jgi:hypothetical protein
MSTPSFMEQVCQHLAFLNADCGFVVVHQEYYPEHFGNALVVMQSGQCRIRILKEKGQVLVEFGPLWAPQDWACDTPDVWFDLAILLGFLTRGRCEWQYQFDDASSDPAARVTAQLDRLAGVLHAYC